MPRYFCRTVLTLGEDPVRCERPEAYRARDNRALHAHLCVECWLLLEPEKRSEYVKLLAEGSEES